MARRGCRGANCGSMPRAPCFARKWNCSARSWRSFDFQKESREIRAEANKDKKGKFGMLDPETQKKITKLDKEAVAKVVDLLDDTQKKQWKELTGEAFDLSKLQTGFGIGKNKKKDE